MMIKMSKNIEKKFNRIIENSDPQELEDKLVNYTNEAIDDALLNENKNDGLEKMRTFLKFFQDHKHYHPKNFSRALNKIKDRLLVTLLETLVDAVVSNHEKKLSMHVIAIIDLMSFNSITESIDNYQEKKG